MTASPNGAGSTNLLAGTDSGVFLTTDNGASWATSLADQYVRAIATNGATFAAGSGNHGVFISTNSGASWTSSNSGLASNNINSLAFLGSQLFVGTNDAGIFRSTNNGTNWSTANTGLGTSPVLTMTVKGGVLFAGGPPNGFFISVDSGGMWGGGNTGLPNNDSSNDVHALTSSWSNLFAGTDNGVFISTNYGTSWSAANNGMSADSIYALTAIASSLFAGSNRGVFLSTDNGTSWNAVSTGTMNQQTVCSLAVIGSSLFAGTLGGGVWRRPLSEMLTDTTGLEASIGLIAPTSGEVWGSGTQQDITWTSNGVNNIKLEYSTDWGTDWAVITASTPASSGSYLWTVPVALSTECKIRISDVNNGTFNDVNVRDFVIYTTTGPFIATSNNLGITTPYGEYGCAWGDYDGDGYLDLYIPGADFPSTLYRNVGGTHFVDVSTAMGIAGQYYGAANGAVWADFNGDGRLDLLCTDRGLRLYRNDGPVFTDISVSSHLSSVDSGAILWQTAVGDFNRDGNLDIALAGANASNGQSGRARPIRILRNDNGVFTDVAPAMGVSRSLESWNPAWVDVNNDGYLDLWMPTVRTSNAGCTLLINQGGQLVISDPNVTGIKARSAIVSCWGDFNNDGYMDLFLIPWSGDNDGVAKLYRNNGDGTFTDVAHSVGLDQAFPLARGAYWGDYDNDGKLDLLIGGWGGGGRAASRSCITMRGTTSSRSEPKRAQGFSEASAALCLWTTTTMGNSTFTTTGPEGSCCCITRVPRIIG
jgi:hypothetical protein